MISMYKVGEITAAPNAQCFTMVINGCAHCAHDTIEKREAVGIAIKTYKELISCKYVKPTSRAFVATVTAIRNLMPQCDKRSAAIASIFQTAVDGGLVSESLLQRVQSSLTEQDLHRCFEANGLKCASSDAATMNYADCPSSWCSHVGSRSIR